MVPTDPRSELAQVWPIFGLVLESPRLRLRAASARDIVAIGANSYYGGGPRRGAAFTAAELFARAVARSVADWEVENWNIVFAVWRDDEIVGLQELSAHDFPRVRVVETPAWVVSEHRGEGIGQEMRRAVLHLAFHELHAAAAHADPLIDNQPAIQVNRRLGYTPRLDRASPSDRLPMVLTQEAWRRASHLPVHVVRLGPCLPLFGIPSN